MKCASCEWSICCKYFSFYHYYDGEKIVDAAPFPFEYIVVMLEVPNFIATHFCCLQLADGKCLIHENKPRICDNYRC